MIHFRCLGCNCEIEVPDEYAGRAARCPTCGRRIRVPRKAAARPAPSADDVGEPLEESSSTTAVFRVEGRTYQVRPRLEGLLVAAATIIGLSALVFLGVGLTAPVYSPWFLAGLVGSGFALFGALLVLPAYYNIRRSRGRKTGERMAFINVAAAGVLIVALLSAAMIAKAMSDTSPCRERFALVYKALRAYAAANDGLFPPQPETLVDQGYLAASKLTCPKVPGARQGAPTYDRRSYLRYKSGEAVVDLRTDVPRFPGDLLILMGGGVHEFQNKSSGKIEEGRFVLTLDGTISYVLSNEKDIAEALTMQRRIVNRVLSERRVDREQQPEGDSSPPGDGREPASREIQTAPADGHGGDG